MNKEVIFINSHPIQYFTPLYKYLNEQNVPTSAWYCTDKTVKGSVDKEFGVTVKWDIPLLEGYSFRFFKNYSLRPSHEKGFFGLMNFGLLKNIFTIEKSLIVVHGWHYCTHLLVILLAKLRGHTVCLRYEMPYNQEVLKAGWKQKLKIRALKIVFSRLDYFLYIGTQNKLLYQKLYGLPEDRLLFCPYSVDNSRFAEAYLKLVGCKIMLRQKRGIPIDHKIILYSGKYIEKKRPMDILQAYQQMNLPGCWLIMLGDGELRPKMEQFIAENKLDNVLLTGFVNQSEITEYYTVADVFVMCSTIGETWGLTVNEALNFNLPIVVSDHTGSATDLVVEGENGYVFKTGDIADLKEKVEKALTIDTNILKYPSTIIETYSYQTTTNTLKKIV